MTTRIRLGDLLVSSQLVTEAQIEEALTRQKETGRRLGETLVALGYVTELQVAQTLSHQLSVPWVNLHHVDFSRELLNLVAADVAVSARVVPIYVRKVRQHGDVLFVATDDPLNEPALLQVSAHVGMPVRAMVASALDLRDALRVYYGRVVPAPEPEASGEDVEIEVDVPVAVVQSIRPPAVEPSAASPLSPAPEAPPEVGGAASWADDAPRETASAAAEEPTRSVLRQKKRAPSRPRMLSLTLLDGTTVTLPQPSAHHEEASAEHHLTSRDLIQALLLRAEGKDVSKVLGDAHWETLFAALLSLLLKKGVVADWEFVEQWNKVRRATGG